MCRIITMLILFATAASLVGCERYALDRQMEELCKKDGGIKVYETITLSPAEYDKLLKYVTIAKTQEDIFGPDYRYVWISEALVGKDADPEKGQGRLTRNYLKIYRRSDGKLLGEAVTYGRSGGDGFTFGFHPSSKVCPHFERGLGDSVFIKGE
jgi:hypothetical protein